MVTVQVQAVVMDKGVDKEVAVIRAMGRAMARPGATAVVGVGELELAPGMGMGMGMAWAKVVGLALAGVAALEVDLVLLAMVEEMGAQGMVEA